MHNWENWDWNVHQLCNFDGTFCIRCSLYSVKVT